MGWSAVLLMPEIIRAKRWVFLGLLSLGGILYSVGVIFYAKKDRGWFHFIWHLCIIGASISHFIAIIFFQS
jgi:hemolysin III